MLQGQPSVPSTDGWVSSEQALGRTHNQAGLLRQRNEFPRRPGPGALVPPGHKEAPLGGASEHPTQQEVPPRSQVHRTAWLFSSIVCALFSM